MSELSNNVHVSSNRNRVEVSDDGNSVTVSSVGVQGASGVAGALDALTDVTVSLPQAKQILYYTGAIWRNASLSATDLTSGTFADAQISLSSVKQYDADLDIAASQITSAPMVGVITAADAGAARTVLAAAASDHTHADAYTGQIEAPTNKTFTIEPGAVSGRTITGFYIKSASGTCTATLKVGTNTVKAASVSSSSGDQTSLANTAVAVNDVITIVVSSNSSAIDVIFSVEYTA